jgi:hypothetical protein
MRRKKSIIIFFAVAIVTIVTGFYLLSRNRTQTATTYEDRSGYILVCSEPIPVKDQGVRYMSGAPSLTPINQADANLFCHQTGIE